MSLTVDSEDILTVPIIIILTITISIHQTGESFFEKKNIVAFTYSDDDLWNKKISRKIDTLPDNK